MYLIRWVKLTNSGARLHERTIDSSRRALAYVLRLEDDANVERVDLIIDKGAGSNSREGKDFATCEEVRDWFNTPEDEDA